MALTSGGVVAGDGAVTDTQQIGGKGAGLQRLVQAGAKVPPFVVLRPALTPEARAARLDEAVAAWAQLGSGKVAVRSSALNEDGEAVSFAGQYVSVLGADTAARVREAVETCWASAESERVRAYCAIHKLEPAPVAVVVQGMIEGEVSGVMFTATPEDPERVLISAGFGLGEGVVQGAVACDTFRVGEQGIEVDIQRKETAVRLVDGAPKEVPVLTPEAPALSESRVRELASWGRTLASRWGAPQDIEWTLSGGTLYLLQARPITTPIPRGRRLLWDNSNIIESYNGVTTPLTYSFASFAYSIVYQQALQVLGVPLQTVRANSGIFPRMIGLVQGRIYYNLNAWYRLITLLPGYRANKAFMEQMMGVSEAASDADAEAEASAWQRTFIEYPRLVGMFVQLGWKMVTVESQIRDFEDHFREVYARHRNKDLEATPPEALVEIYEELERELLWRWTAPIVNDFFTMIFYGLLKKLCQQWVAGGQPTELHNELVSGEGGMESLAPMKAALALADILRREPSLQAKILALSFPASPEAIAETLREARRFGPFAHAWDDYMARFGDRCVNELKLETPSLRQDPSFLLQTLQNYLRNPPGFGAGGEGDAARARAEREAFGKLDGWRRVVFQRVLNQARARVRQRENLRFLRTRIFGMVRDIFRALGAHMVRAGALKAVEDVFYLTVTEALGWARGTTATLAFAPQVEARRAEFAAYRAAPAPADRFHTFGAVHAGNRFQGAPVPSSGKGGGDTLEGTPVSPGRVEGRAAVLADPEQGAALAGEILVAFRTDPGWVPLYPSISGLIVERGSLLSHSAVVAREIGLPTIIGVKGATTRIAHGQAIRLDAGAGQVHLGAQQGEERQG